MHRVARPCVPEGSSVARLECQHIAGRVAGDGDSRIRREAACAVGVAALGKEMRSSQLIDGKVWDGSDPAGYARSFKLHAMSNSSHRLASR